MSIVDELDTQQLMDVVASSDCNLALAAERLNKKLGLERNTIKEYDIKERVSRFDVQSFDQFSARLRTLMTIKLFDLVMAATDLMSASLGDLKPADLAKLHPSLVNTFATLTASSTKVTFDFNREIEDIAREFPDIPVEDIKAGIKEIESRTKINNIRALSAGMPKF